MIYENYFQVPDGEMCRPNMNVRFHKKEKWVTDKIKDEVVDSPHHFQIALGKWETEGKKITITENDFDSAVKRVYPGEDLKRLKEEIFK